MRDDDESTMHDAPVSAMDRRAIAAYWAEARPGGDYTKAPLADDYLFVGPPMTLRGRTAHEALSPAMTAICFPEPARILHQHGVPSQDGGGSWWSTILEWQPAGHPDGLRLAVTQSVVGGVIHEEYWAYDARRLGPGLVERLRPLVEPLGGQVGLP